MQIAGLSATTTSQRRHFAHWVDSQVGGRFLLSLAQIHHSHPIRQTDLLEKPARRERPARRGEVQRDLWHVVQWHVVHMILLGEPQPEAQRFFRFHLRCSPCSNPLKYWRPFSSDSRLAWGWHTCSSFQGNFASRRLNTGSCNRSITPRCAVASSGCDARSPGTHEYAAVRGPNLRRRESRPHFPSAVSIWPLPVRPWIRDRGPRQIAP